MEFANRARTWLQGIYGTDPNVVYELGDDRVIVSYPIFQKLFNKSVISGREEIYKFAVGFCERWKQTEVTFHETVLEGNRVVLIWSFRGCNVGSAHDDHQPTKDIHHWGGITLVRFNDAGRIVAEIGEESDPGPMGRLKAVYKDDK